MPKGEKPDVQTKRHHDAAPAASGLADGATADPGVVSFRVAGSWLLSPGAGRRGGPRSPGVPTPSGPVAQLAEQQTLNLLVEGSTPSRLTNFSLRSSWFRPGGPQPQGSGPSDLALEVDSPDGSLTRLAFGSPRCAFRFAQVGFARRSSAIAGRA